MHYKKLTAYFALLLLPCAAIANAPFDWTGFYLGGFIGGAFDTRITTTEPLRLDNDTYWFRPFHHSFSDDSNASFIGGGTIGFNWQINSTPILLGLEGEYGYLKMTATSVDPNQIPYTALPGNNIQNNISEHRLNIGNAYGYGLVSGRVGYVYDRVLFYVKSGAVFTQIESQYTSQKTDDTSTTGLAFLNIEGTHNPTGYAIGGGIEYGLPFQGFTNVTAKFEYLYLGFKNQTAYGHCSCHYLWRIDEDINGINMLKLGMSYNFW